MFRRRREKLARRRRVFEESMKVRIPGRFIEEINEVRTEVRDFTCDTYPVQFHAAGEVQEASVPTALSLFRNPKFIIEDEVADRMKGTE